MPKKSQELIFYEYVTHYIIHYVLLQINPEYYLPAGLRVVDGSEFVGVEFSTQLETI